VPLLDDTGGYAYVYLVEDVSSGEQFALKRILAQVYLALWSLILTAIPSWSWPTVHIEEILTCVHCFSLMSNQSDEQKRLTAQEVAIMVRIVVCQQCDPKAFADFLSAEKTNGASTHC